MSRRRLSSERAKTALCLLIAINILIYAYRDNFRSHLHLRRTYRIHDGNFQSMLLSIFYHMEPTHLFVNMIALHRYGSELFVNSSSRKWQSVFVVILSYVACGIGAFLGIELLSCFHEYQWEQKLSKARYASRCNHWLCDSLNGALGEDVSGFFTNAWADLTTSFQFADLKMSMWYYQAIYRIGASGVVYGWMGMRLVTSWLSSHHSRLDGLDYFFLIATLAHDLKESPLSLEDLRMSVLLESDGVDHAAHLMGAIFGMFWALALILWEKVTSFGFGGRRWWGSSGGGTGRRLGARWEDEQLLHQQQQQRRDNSRLLNSQGGDQRRPLQH
eukprot:CAMPEP_0172302794 /NCGR_PEP_ID=MMETSP1058-20130122/4452_1 /TAXON_ID=83371 /ORGANISM="Detonula confervacea, Strain CCMP 353" /LENGTH=329 /DNA_ID=CAMNT_0013013409 /DNA_START=84 /DNA_END=1070 /DNA_ORIENTATION=+